MLAKEEGNQIPSSSSKTSLSRISSDESLEIKFDPKMMESYGSTISTAHWAEPPKSFMSRIGRRQKERDKQHQKRFITRLRAAFDESDTKQKGRLTFEQWKSSTLKMIIHDGHMTPDEYEKYFLRIDADFDGKISWNELVQYLMKEITSVDLGKSNNNAQFIQKAPTPPHLRKELHRDMVSQISICSRTGEYLTLSQDSIRFWNPTDLTFNRAITEPGMFAAMLVFDSSLTLAVTTTNRRLIFFELDTLMQLPAEISASPSPKKIHMMNERDAHRALQVLSSNMPLFNVPTVMTDANLTFGEPGVDVFFIGDDQGVVEAFEMIAPRRRLGMDYHVERIGRMQIHDGAITQISKLECGEMYGSCSVDHTLKLWNFTPGAKVVVERKRSDNASQDSRSSSVSTVKRIPGTFNILRVFTDDGPITNFIYSDYQKVIVTCGVSRDAYIWSLSPPRKIFKLGGHYNMLAHVSEFVTTNGEKFILTMTAKKEFRLWDSVNYRLVREWSDHTPMRPENRFSAAIFDFKRNTLITASGDVVKWCEDTSAMSESQELRTHNRPIVGCLYSHEFDQIVTVDSISTIKVWNTHNGKSSSKHQSVWTPDSSDIAAVTLDSSGRRMITSSFKNDVVMWNYNSGTKIADLKLTEANSLITNMQFAHINGRDYLVRAGWDKTIALFCEIETCKFELYREFKAHTRDISAIAGFPNGVASGSVNGEIYSWSMDTNTPIAGIELFPPACVECLIYGNQCLFVGDSNGYLHILLVPKLQIVTSVFAHKVLAQHSLSTMCYDSENNILYTADTFGYVKQWRVLDGSKLEEGQIVRCHNDEITSLVVFDHGKFIATCGVDMFVRVWSTMKFQLVGFFSDGQTWDLNDESTWINKAPYSADPKHFASVSNRRNSVIRSANLGTVRSLRNLPQMRSDDTTSEKTKDEEEEIIETDQKPFDFEAIERIVHEMNQDIRMPGNNNYHVIDMIRSAPVEMHTFKNAPQLETSTRPSELMNTITGLITKKKPIRKRGAGVSSAAARSKLIKMPIPVGPPKKRVKSKKNVPFLVQTTPYY